MNSNNISGHDSRDDGTDALEAEIRAAFQDVRATSFADGFEDRAWARWNRERASGPGMFEFIERRAMQLLPLAIAASMILAVYSSRHNRTVLNADAPFVVRMLGWNERSATAANANELPTYESVYASLYGLPELNSSSGAR